MRTVLVTAAGGDIGQGVLTSLSLLDEKFRIITSDISPRAAGPYLGDRGYLVSPAKKDEQQFISRMVEICNAEKVDIVFICHEDEQFAFAKNREKFETQSSTYLMVQSLSTLEVTRDKAAFYKKLQAANIRTPKTVDPAEVKSLIQSIGFPLVVKPCGSSGSRNFSVVHDDKALSDVIAATPDAIVQEYITNDREEEYTVGIFMDNQSKSLGAIPILRTMRFGMTVWGMVDQYPDVVAVAVKAAEAVKAVGPTNVQLRRDKAGEVAVIEINARISSSSVFRSRLGFNEVRSSIEYFLDNKQPELKFEKAVVIRTWGDLIIPIDRYLQLEKDGVIDNKKEI
ncbi:MAG: hypothetical protein A2840_02695 [Candidatus Buchananbacteria bacterium RIFCSPHIGHO2_01_FULL_47_11b]|uniref:ATP-grasp domain-containing protein n=1 Tax=Candidatus Buchananbacteria bacterium RIFCSPHIGHO2_01_FULL_47_11b TaxID=1797537 RepID=A0A1G1Y3S8_9BACT|nr:MAG: hypothetical protein A2840_02695 [Candidatus Buchananbacteria bacterium RIFCSPHIGHO2_01_FULL_47_11b]